MRGSNVWLVVSTSLGFESTLRQNLGWRLYWIALQASAFGNTTQLASFLWQQKWSQQKTSKRLEQFLHLEFCSEPAGQANHSRLRFFSHLAFAPRLASAWANNSETMGKNIGEHFWAFVRLLIARDRNWRPACCLTSSIQMAPVTSYSSTKIWTKCFLTKNKMVCINRKLHGTIFYGIIYQNCPAPLGQLEQVMIEDKSNISKLTHEHQHLNN